jgi:hypothetical protein
MPTKPEKKIWICPNNSEPSSSPCCPVHRKGSVNSCYTHNWWVIRPVEDEIIFLILFSNVDEYWNKINPAIHKQLIQVIFNVNQEIIDKEKDLVRKIGLLQILDLHNLDWNALLLRSKDLEVCQLLCKHYGETVFIDIGSDLEILTDTIEGDDEDVFVAPWKIELLQKMEVNAD